MGQVQKNWSVWVMIIWVFLVPCLKFLTKLEVFLKTRINKALI